MTAPDFSSTDPASDPTPRSGYTLPVFACASAIAALKHLQFPTQPISSVAVNLREPPQTVDIAVEQVATLSSESALAITRSDPGDNLDLTRHTPVWAKVEWSDANQSEPVELIGGAGIGRLTDTGQSAIYRYATQLLQANLTALLNPEDRIRVTIILPEGKALAQRTSNAAFGVVDGLSLLGTTGIAQPLSAPGQLETYRQQLRQIAAVNHTPVVFCIGENGLDLAHQMGIPSERRIKTANWIGPLLVEACLFEIPAILLFGYHGKLIKLAGGIFHTHHHVADGRQEILTACCIAAGLPTAIAQQILASPTTEAALNTLQKLDQETGSTWVSQIYSEVAQRIDLRSHAYIGKHTDQSQAQAITIGSLLFDRQRQVICTSQNGAALLAQFTQ